MSDTDPADADLVAAFESLMETHEDLREKFKETTGADRVVFDNYGDQHKVTLIFNEDGALEL